VSLDQILAQFGEDDFIAQELSRLVIDHQDIYFVRRHRSLLLASPHQAATGKTESSRSAGLIILIR
jgi:hypothetical protein